MRRSGKGSNRGLKTVDRLERGGWGGQTKHKIKNMCVHRLFLVGNTNIQ